MITLKINLPLFAEGYLKDELTHLKPCGGEDSPERCDSDIPCPIWAFCVCDSNCFTPTSTLIFRDSFPCSGSVQSPPEGGGENKRQKFPTQTKCPCSAPKPHQRQIKRLPKKKRKHFGIRDQTGLEVSAVATGQSPASHIPSALLFPLHSNICLSRRSTVEFLQHRNGQNPPSGRILQTINRVKAFP